MGTNKRLMTVDEVAACLGVPKTTLYAWNYKGGGPRRLRVGRHVRYRWSDVERWLSDQAVDS
jgi:excisionase family DNA binding protein